MNKILIVDDEEAIQLLYSDEFIEEGYQVITASGGEDLLEIIHRQKPDLILLDIKMKKVDGGKVLQEIRKSYYDLPIIIVTAYPAFKYDIRSIAAHDFIIKSSDLRKLKLKIKMVMEGGRGLLRKNSHEKGEKADHLLSMNEQLELSFKN